MLTVLACHAGLAVAAGLDNGRWIERGVARTTSIKCSFVGFLPCPVTLQGMNLASGLESNPNAFYIVVGAIAGQSCCLWGHVVRGVLCVGDEPRKFYDVNEVQDVRAAGWGGGGGNFARE